jgi:DNA-directed RNA polymerase specialized sigma subunit
MALAAIHDQRECLHQKMAGALTRQEHELLILRYFEELPTSQILEVMEITRAVSRGLHRCAMAKMDRILEDPHG